MKIWKEKSKIPGFGICEIRELTDKEVGRARKTKPDEFPMPFSHGFVNMYQDGKFVGICGVGYAEEMQIRKSKPISKAKGYRPLSKEDKTELQKFAKFLKLLTKRKDLIGQSEIRSAQIVDECYTAIYGDHPEFP